MTADPTTKSRAAFEAAVAELLTFHGEWLRSLERMDVSAHGVNMLHVAFEAARARLLALQAAQSAAAGAPDAAVEGVESAIQMNWVGEDANKRWEHFVRVPGDWSPGTRVLIQRLPSPEGEG